MFTIPDDLKIKFKNMINQRAGLYFKDYCLRDLENAIAQRMQIAKIDSALNYFNTLTFSSRKASASMATGGSIATKVNNCKRWLCSISRIAPAVS